MGLWVLPAAYAYSLYFCIFWVAFITGYTILLCQLGVRPVIAAFGALCLLFSGLVQTWWTTNAPTFAFAPWPAIILLLKLKPAFKLPLLIWTMGIWIFALLYPPFIISAAFALGIAVLAFRRDVLNLRNLAVAAVALVTVAILLHGYFGPLIEIMRNTVYPGSRVSSGGGIEVSRLVSHLFPFFVAADFTPLLPPNICEISTVGTLLPLALLCFTEPKSVWTIINSNPAGWSVAAAGLLLMLAWMTLPVPPQLGRLFLWSYVPPGRMAWGFGLLLTIATLQLLSNSRLELSSRRRLVFGALLIGAVVASKMLHTLFWRTAELTFGQAVLESSFDWLALLVFLITAGLLSKNTAASAEPARRVAFAGACAAIVTFGTFNPIQPAFPIFNVPHTDKIGHLKHSAEASPNHWAVLPYPMGATLQGKGRGHRHLAPFGALRIRMIRRVKHSHGTRSACARGSL